MATAQSSPPVSPAPKFEVDAMVLSGGGQLTRRQHLLSHDGRQLLVCMANAVRVYSTATAELLFEMQGHTDEVTDLCLDPSSPSQVRSDRFRLPK